MKQLKKIFAASFLAGVCIATPALAAEEDDLGYKPFPHMFVGIQGGGQATISDYSFSKLITPTASVSFGGWFSPIVGARLHVNGIWNKCVFNATETEGEAKYKYKYVTTDLDVMLNLVTLFGKKNYYPLNVYLIGGIGLNTAWDNDEANALGTRLSNTWDGKRMSHNARIGAQLDYNICKNVSINLEVDANNLNDRYNSQANNRDDWQLTAQLGLAFKFGYKKPVVIPEVWETRVDTIWYDDVVYKDVDRDRDIKREIFFEIRESDVETTDEQIKAVAEFLQTVKDAEITIVAYADAGTGNPKLNMMYSELRAKKTQQALVDNGVDPDIIKSVEWRGDTEQPYEENDKNRVSIIVGHGIYADKEAETVRKFRTEEVRYRVQ